MKKISIVLPCLNEAENLPLLIPEIIKLIPKKYDYEIICTDDGSIDGTSDIITALASKNKRIKGIFFYRRYGHQEGLRAGIEKSTGAAIITMDADFQHPPTLIPEFIKLWEKGFDLIQAKKKDDSSATKFRKLQRRIGYYIWSKASDGALISGVSDFRLMNRPVVDFISKSSESGFFLRGLVMLAAKKPTTISYSVGKRRYGKSSYSTRAFINMFINGFLSFSAKPLRVASIFGITILLSTSAFIIIDTIRILISGVHIIEGWMTLIFLSLLLNGFVIFYMGMLGEYLGIIFKEVKKRPTHLIEKTINFD